MPSPSYVEVRIRDAKFFDRDIDRSLSATHRKALSRFGAYVRHEARRSMRTARALDKDIRSGRRRKGNRGTIKVYRPKFRSDGMGGYIEEGGKTITVDRKPSKPGTPPRAVKGHIKRFLFFEYDKATRNVIVGPLWLPPAKNLLSRFPVTAVHEQKETQHQYVMRRLKNKSVSQVYPQRPYMVPAFQKNLKKLDNIYKDSIRR